MKNLPDITLVMPTFNGEQYIDQALDSILMQRGVDFELLVCDGGSTDRTIQLIEARGDSRIHIVSRTDINLPDGINIGFSQARGKILAWINCDDVYLHANALSRVLEAFRERRCDYLLGVSGMMSVDDRVYRLLMPWIPAWPFAYRGHSNVFTGSLFFSSKVWQQFGGFPVEHNLAFEYALIEFLMNNKYHGSVLSAPALSAFRIRPDSLSGANTEKMRQQQSNILGCKVIQPIPFFHSAVRAYSLMVRGHIPELLQVNKLNRCLPKPWQDNF